jgi:hypothetical protein
MKRTPVLGLIAVLACPAVAQEAAVQAPTAAETRPAQWAEPVALEGVPNLHRITPTLYRSEQPSALGMKNLETLGIRTVINLRYFNDDKDEVEGTSLRTEHTKILTWRIGDKHVIEVMQGRRRTVRSSFIASMARIAPAS